MKAPKLSRRTVVVTRSQAGAAGLRELLEERGATVITVPTIRFEVSDDLRDWESALAARLRITHLVFTSQVAVDHFALLARNVGLAEDAWSHCRVAAVGQATADAVERAGWRCEIRVGRSTGADLAVSLVRDEGVGPESFVLMPQSDLARPDAARCLESAGATVIAATIYRTRPEDPDRAAPLLEAIEAGSRIDAVTFASPSAVRGFLAMTGDVGRRLLAGSTARIVSIGTVTSSAVREEGLEVAAEADRPGVRELAEAVERALSLA